MPTAVGRPQTCTQPRWQLGPHIDAATALPRCPCAGHSGQPGGCRLSALGAGSACTGSACKRWACSWRRQPHWALWYVLWRLCRLGRRLQPDRLTGWPAEVPAQPPGGWLGRPCLRACAAQQPLWDASITAPRHHIPYLASVATPLPIPFPLTCLFPKIPCLICELLHQRTLFKRPLPPPMHAPSILARSLMPCPPKLAGSCACAKPSLACPCSLA